MGKSTNKILVFVIDDSLEMGGGVWIVYGECAKKSLKKLTIQHFSATHTYIKLTLVSFFFTFIFSASSPKQNWYSTQIFTQPHVGTPCGKVLPPNLYYQRRTKCIFETWKQLGGFKSTWDVEPLQYWYVLRCPAKETDLNTETSGCEWRWKSWTNWGQNDFKEEANWGMSEWEPAHAFSFSSLLIYEPVLQLSLSPAFCPVFSDKHCPKGEG